MISQLRELLIADLSGVEAVTVHNVWPERFNPPGIMVVTPRDGQYIVAGQFRDHYEVILDLVLVTKPHSNANTELSALDTLIEQVLAGTQKNWAFRGVDAIALINIQGNDYPGTVVHLARQESLGE